MLREADVREAKWMVEVSERMVILILITRLRKKDLFKTFLQDTVAS